MFFLDLQHFEIQGDKEVFHDFRIINNAQVNLIPMLSEF